MTDTLFNQNKNIGKKYNTLTGDKTYKLFRYIDENIATLRTMSARTAAETATSALGFTVSEYNYYNAVRATGHAYQRPVMARASKKQITQILARAILKLAEHVGCDVSPDITFIATRRRTSENGDKE